MKWVCINCGSTDVQVKTWIDANNKIVDSSEMNDKKSFDSEDSWCNTCQEHNVVQVKDED